MASTAHEVGIQLRRILFATDFSPASEKALHYALAVARSYGSKVYLFHAASSTAFTLGGPDVCCLAEEVATRDLRSLESQLQSAGELAGLTHEVMVRQGDIREQLQHVVEQERIDLVALGTHGRTGVSRVVLGSVAEQIFRAVTCPVLTVGPGASASRAPLRRVLFATDFSAGSNHALNYAVSLANQNHARLILLHSVMPFPVMEPGALWYTGTDLAGRQQTARAIALDKMNGLLRGVHLEQHPVEFVVEFQYAPDAILQAADAYRADLIVMGVKAATKIGMTHAPWATAHEVVCGATCPVLTVRG
jgi:nucleotide-binding universal stress UspA family protein